MTAFNDIMLAEQEAAQEILSTKEQSVSLLVAARAAHVHTVQAEEMTLHTNAALARKKQAEKIDTVVKTIQKETESAVSVVKQKFATKRNEVLATLVSRFQ